MIRGADAIANDLRGRGFMVDRVVRPGESCSPFRVLVGGRDYAGFVDEASARGAADLLREFWPAASGKRIDVSVRN